MDIYEQEYQYPKSFSMAPWKKIFPFAKPMGKRFIIIVALLLVNALIDIAYPLMLSYGVDNFLVPQTFVGIPAYAVALAALGIVQVLSTYFFLRLALYAEFSITAGMRSAVVKHLQILPISYYNQTPVGYIMARAISDTGNIGDRIVWTIVDMSWALAYTAFAVITMLILNWRLGLVMVAFMVLLFMAASWFQRKILGINRDLRRKNSIMTGAMNEGIVGARTTKTLVLEEQNLAEFKGITGDMKKTATILARVRAMFGPAVFFMGSVAVALVVTLGGGMSINTTLQLGTLAAFVNFALGVLWPLFQLAHIWPEFVASQANVERVTMLLEHQPEIIEKPEVIKKYGDNFNPKHENWEPLLGDVEFKDVTFMYPDGNVNVLENFSLKVPQGTTVAIVGETGAGKSTLVNLVCRFFEPTEGQVLIDGRDIQDRTQLWLHSHLGYVLQNPHLFSGSIRENIRYGKLNATDRDIEVAAQAVGADDFISKLENGWDTDVGEGGDKLSTGQKQLVSLARAVLAKPRIFILDEATSSIDTETEKLVQDATAILLEGRTSFVIAHRLSTIREADIILVVHDGKIIERGSHDELMAAAGEYHKLYTQLSVEG
jgi:ATP-binding cassette subfamily B protein